MLRVIKIKEYFALRFSASFAKFFHVFIQSIAVEVQSTLELLTYNERKK